MDRIASAQPHELYMVPLPPSCVDWSSSVGRARFREALASGTLDTYFPLAAQFVTQADPSYCGLGTLTMVLNALNIDPGRVWKGVWRWYHETMFDCCVPLSVVRESGISLDTFACLARCNGAAVSVVRAVAAVELAVEGATGAVADGGRAAGLLALRFAVRDVSRTSGGSFLVASYNRKSLGQTGSGHFSPLAGYHEASDSVLVLDVARFKYPPHWVTLDRLYSAMQDKDKETGLLRGWVHISSSSAVPLLFFAFGTLTFGRSTPVVHTMLSSCTSLGSASAIPSECCECNRCTTGQGRSMVSAGARLFAAAQTINRFPGAGDSFEAAISAATKVLIGTHGGVDSMLAGDEVGDAVCAPLLALTIAGDRLSLTDDMQCLTRMPRERMSAVAELLANIQDLSLFVGVHAALRMEIQRRGGSDDCAEQRVAKSLMSSERTHTKAEHGNCAHEPLTCVRVHTAHVLTVMLLTMYSGGGATIGKAAAADSGSDASSILRAAVSESLLESPMLVCTEVALLRRQILDMSNENHQHGCIT